MLWQQWRQKVVFDADCATYTNAPVILFYESVQAVRFSYWVSMHTSYRTIVLELKQTSSLVPAALTVWDLNDFSMSTIAHILLELCQRTSMGSVEIKESRRDFDPGLLRVLKRHGQIRQDTGSRNSIFTPF